VTVFDPRLTLARGDLAAQALEGVLPAARYAEPATLQAAIPVIPIHKARGDEAELGDQLLFGELFDVLETDDEWAFGQASRSGYVGWARREGLSDTLSQPTHWVRALRTVVFAEPSYKAPVRAQLSMNALVATQSAQEGYAEVVGMGWIPEAHLAPLGEWEADPAAVALSYLGIPYVWGGRDSLGIDCSGLVQQALYACGLGCPRDSDMQAALGEVVDPGPELGNLRRNDLVFWRGHVGIMLDGEILLHANSTHMAVAPEPLPAAIERKLPNSGPPTAYRRLKLIGEA